MESIVQQDETAVAKKKAAIEAAFRRLPIAKDKEGFVQSAVDMLAKIDYSVPWVAPAKFTKVGRTRTQKELDTLIKHAEALADSFDALHEPALHALEDNDLWKLRLEAPVALRTMANQIKKVDCSEVPVWIEGGKPVDRQAQSVGNLISYHFSVLTGRTPTLTVCPYKENTPTSGLFMTLVEDVLAAIGLEASAEHIARTEIERIRTIPCVSA